MLAVKAIYENGKVRLLQGVGNIKKARAYVILIPEDAGNKDTEQRIIQQIEPIKIKGEDLSKTIIKERSESYYLMKMQQETGYIQALLDDPDEDKWTNVFEKLDEEEQFFALAAQAAIEDDSEEDAVWRKYLK